ncbi:MAG: pentapeptide repeat-containing protein [Gemmataceae bacterium]
MIEIKRQFTDETIHKVEADSLTGANLARMNLAVAVLSGMDLRGANLEGANLAVADLSRSNLTGCDLRGANLTGANLNVADLTGANLQGANLTGADLDAATLREAQLQGANFTGANLTGVDLPGAQLQGANFTGASLTYATLTGAVFDDHTQFPALLFDPERTGGARKMKNHRRMAPMVSLFRRCVGPRLAVSSPLHARSGSPFPRSPRRSHRRSDIP